MDRAVPGARGPTAGIDPQVVPSLFSWIGSAYAPAVTATDLHEVMTLSRPAPLLPLAAIDFGAPSAERDIERGLEEYFVESEAYSRVRSGAKRIMVGNRGIGKSAIFQVLARRERDQGSYVIELSPEDYSYELLSQTMASEHSGSWAKLGAYAGAGKYLIYVLIMKEVSRRKVHLKRGEAYRIYKHIRDHHANDNASKLSALVSYLKRMEGAGDREPAPDYRARGRTGPWLGLLRGRPGVPRRPVPGLPVRQLPARQPAGVHLAAAGAVRRRSRASTRTPRSTGT